MPATDTKPMRDQRLTLVLRPAERAQIESARHALEQRGIRVSLSRLATAALLRGLNVPAT